MLMHREKKKMWSESTPPPAAKKTEQAEELPTPPVQTPVSIPFHWEEVPGKPRDNNNSTKPKPKPKAVRSLDLPPAKKISSNDSPSPIMEGAAEESGKGVTHTLSFSFGKLSFRSPEGGGGSSKRHIGKEGSHRWNLISSWRWAGSFRINNNEVADGGNMDFSDHLQATTSPFEISNLNHNQRTRFSKKKSNLLANIYKSFKQAVPWRRKQKA